MNITKIIAVAFASFALVACGGEEEAKAWPEADAKAYTEECVKAGGDNIKAKCDCQVKAMGAGDTAWADREDEAKKEAYGKAEDAAKEKCKDSKDAA